ncbi:DUF1330 domain-containing protein [Salipiger marinus]|jgi:uncharacterized protein (DUF1330 family)|uniref:Uncharacterized conserved protein, DUF1330 family n=1 Tax=Salipiger marinus TaxID=555512 RepID=A0A1G8T975_9RHOB|nr:MULTISPECIES: DUF1330 domain-containing protein [Salipiger]HBM61009.1 DUF1330 domain-containing protein [Citreicella sp.]MCD1616895.1 DUF1330 domain-containing protein [Salipiger manganoxidans]MEB3419998.1 DUF1330 domain-containing protein [Salipiger manganoxidans]SDJ37991.1 Uncharacterized conserved protein, DUF1330 family [Salipiger marinus]HBT03104.1 DUF1330 domain-containing protein [Citreicella sp.]|tara:strand:- start:452 stop:736 length:285 start_codon:yes stop_codon:yes gene_type:complete
MTVYIIARIEVTDPEEYSIYAGQTMALAERWGGRFLVKGGPQTVLEGHAPSRHVVIEFPSRPAAEQWFNSPEYQRILPIAQRSSNRDLVIVEGI